MDVDPRTETEIMQALMRWIRAWEARDVDAVMRCYVPDEDVSGLGSGPDEIGLGRAGLEFQVRRTIEESDSIGLRFEWHRIARERDTAWVFGDATMTGSAYGNPIEMAMRFTVIFVRRHGEWLIKYSHAAVPDPRQPEGTSWPTLIDAVASEVRREQPAIAVQPAPDGTVTLLFSDIENSTGLTDELGDLRWIEVLKEHNAIVRERVAAHSGNEVKTIGDAFMVAFPAARRALLCAIDLQRAFAAYSDEHRSQPIRLRIGLHAGEPVREGGDFYGKSVILASRIAGEAQGEEILASALLRELTSAAGDVRFDAPREATLKGFPDAQLVYPVMWRH